MAVGDREEALGGTRGRVQVSVSFLEEDTKVWAPPSSLCSRGTRKKPVGRACGPVAGTWGAGT